MINFFKKVSVASILTSIAIGILGLIILFNPNKTIALLSLILGIIIMIIGIGKIISYIILRKESNFSNYDLIYGIIAIVISIIMLANANAFATIVRVIIGIWIAYTGIMKLIYALNLKSLSSSSWIAVMIMAIITIIAGVYIAIDSSILIMVFGVILIAYAVIDIIEQIIFMINVNKFIN